MTIQQCYIQMKANYDDVLNRLGTDMLIEKFLKKFMNDLTFNNLYNAFIEKDIQAAFAASHTLKGVSMNLGFTCLAETTSKLTELLRREHIENSDIEVLFLEVQEAYKNTITAIEKYQDKKLEN